MVLRVPTWIRYVGLESLSVPAFGRSDEAEEGFHCVSLRGVEVVFLPGRSRGWTVERVARNRTHHSLLRDSLARDSALLSVV